VAPLLQEAPVQRILFLPNGRSLLVIAGGSARLWDVDTGKPLGPPLPHQAGAWGADLHPDGHLVATTLPDRTVALWQVPDPMPAAPQRLVLWTQVITGMELDADHVWRILDARTWEERRAQLQQVGGPP
jgi:WD40 repeat protein